MGGEVSKHIDKALKDQPLYQRAVDASFSEHSKPQQLPDGTTVHGVEQAYLLDACRGALKRVSEGLPKPASQLCLRPPTSQDISHAFSIHPSFASKPFLTLPHFHTFMNCVVMRVGIDRGVRLVGFATAGIFIVQSVRGTIRKLPLVGGVLSAVFGAVVPPAYAGPLVGWAGALYIQQLSQQHLQHRQRQRLK